MYVIAEFCKQTHSPEKNKNLLDTQIIFSANRSKCLQKRYTNNFNLTIEQRGDKQNITVRN